MKNHILIAFLFIFFTSCNNIFQNSTDRKFVGLWKFYSTDKGKSNDGTMDGVIGTLKKVDGTNETYSFDYLNLNLMYSKKDENILEGVDSKFMLEYNEANQHLILHESPTIFCEFTKLK